LRVLVILVPLILAFIYLPPYLEKITQTFGGLYGGDQFNILEQLKNLSPDQAKTLNSSGININDLLKKLK
jgi:hypothetical protein